VCELQRRIAIAQSVDVRHQVTKPADLDAKDDGEKDGADKELRTDSELRAGCMETGSERQLGARAVGAGWRWDSSRTRTHESCSTF
jgi:hypothetical protein